MDEVLLDSQQVESYFLTLIREATIQENSTPLYDELIPSQQGPPFPPKSHGLILMSLYCSHYWNHLYLHSGIHGHLYPIRSKLDKTQLASESSTVKLKRIQVR